LIARIPGRNGLDLNLALQYDSDNATSEKSYGRLEGFYRHYYSIWVDMVRITEAEKNDIEYEIAHPENSGGTVPTAEWIRYITYANPNSDWFSYAVTSCQEWDIFGTVPTTQFALFTSQKSIKFLQKSSKLKRIYV
jgi:hypothetical protein